MVIVWVKDVLTRLIVVNTSQMYVYQLITLYILSVHKCDIHDIKLEYKNLEEPQGLHLNFLRILLRSEALPAQPGQTLHQGLRFSLLL